MKTALILHAWYNHPSKDWYSWLKTELEKKGYKVLLPDLPELRNDVPDMEVVLTQIEKEASINSNTVVIGHSLGCLLAMRLAERHLYDSMVLVAGWDFDDLTEGHKLFWKTKIDHQKIKNNVKKIFVVHSDNDPYITAAQAEDMAKRLGAKFILVNNAKHFQEKDGITNIPQLLEIL